MRPRDLELLRGGTVAVAAGLLLVAGCSYDMLQTRRYTPFVAATPVAQATLLNAARAVALSFGAHDISVSPTRFRLEANISEDDAPSVRDHVVIDAGGGGRLAIDVRTEVRAGQSMWMGTDDICQGYGYTRERKLAERILGEARVAASTLSEATLGESQVAGRLGKELD